MSLYETTNNVVVEGILSEVNMEYYNYNKVIEGKPTPTEAIRGDFTVKTEEMIDGEKVSINVPVYVFTNKRTNAGKDNPSYANLKSIMEDFVSIAAGGEENATPVRITGASVRMNEYYTADGSRLITYPRINGSFATKVKKEDMRPRATWELTLFISSMGFAYDKEGVETDEFEVKGISVAYNGDVSEITLVTKNPKYAAAIQNSYEVGDTVPFSGKAIFTSETQVITEEVEIGDPIEKTVTRNTSKLVITGVKGAVEEGLDPEDIKKGLAMRKARLEERRSNMNQAKPGETQAPKPDKTLRGW